MQFRYKSLIILRPRKKLRGKKFPASWSRKKKLPVSFWGKKMQLDIEDSTPASDMTYWFHPRIAIDNCYHAITMITCKVSNCSSLQDMSNFLVYSIWFPSLQYESLEGSFSYEFAYPIPPIGYLIGYEGDMKCKLGIQLGMKWNSLNTTRNVEYPESVYIPKTSFWYIPWMHDRIIWIIISVHILRISGLSKFNISGGELHVQLEI